MALLLTDLEDLHHKRYIIILLKPLAHGLTEDRGRKGPERFPAFDLQI
jgi:hypothetical protein